MLKFIRNTLFTTGLSLSLLACFAAFSGGSCIFVNTIFQCLAANACLHIGLMVTTHFTSRFMFVETLVDVLVCTIIILLFGLGFGWFSSTPPVVLVLMVIAVYVISSFVRMHYIREEAKDINERLKKRRERQS